MTDTSSLLEEKTTPTVGTKKKRKARWPWVFLALLVLVGVRVFLGFIEPPVEAEKVDTAPPAQLVSLETVFSQTCIHHILNVILKLRLGVFLEVAIYVTPNNDVSYRFRISLWFPLWGS